MAKSTKCFRVISPRSTKPAESNFQRRVIDPFVAIEFKKFFRNFPFTGTTILENVNKNLIERQVGIEIKILFKLFSCCDRFRKAIVVNTQKPMKESQSRPRLTKKGGREVNPFYSSPSFSIRHSIKKQEGKKRCEEIASRFSREIIPE